MTVAVVLEAVLDAVLRVEVEDVEVAGVLEVVIDAVRAVEVEGVEVVVSVADFVQHVS